MDDKLETNSSNEQQFLSMNTCTQESDTKHAAYTEFNSSIGKAFSQCQLSSQLNVN